MIQNLVWRRREQGATAIIVVVFSILLLVTISVGFMRLVVQDQTRATNNELSKGAYDSALAGVEDGKRALESCRRSNVSDACAAISAHQCDTIDKAKVASEQDDEVKLRSSSGAGDSFDQAYTCVIVNENTPDFVGKLDADTSRLIPLETVASFNSFRVSWYKSTAGGLAGAGYTLPRLNAWGSNKPPILRLQLMMYKKGGYQPTDFDKAIGAGASAGMNTIYLYPKSTVGAPSFGLDSRNPGGGASNLIQTAQCNSSGIYKDFMCSTVVSLPRSIDAYLSTDANAYSGLLRVTAFYSTSSTDFSVEPLNNGSSVNFFGIQPSIDATGRASDIFRRVDARVELVDINDASLYPRAAVDITGNFCKSFYVTNDEEQTFPLGACTP